MIETGASIHLLPLVGLTFLLGLRHGMDPDHLAVVDNLTRFNADAAPERARWCGLFFSLGHGAMVTAVAAALALAAARHTLPPWLDITGQIISIGFLAAIGLMNLAALRRASHGEAVAPRGLRRPVRWRVRTRHQRLASPAHFADRRCLRHFDGHDEPGCRVLARRVG
jgi:ABC-type nickel/cobalt efflux system permease component RcnA